MTDTTKLGQVGIEARAKQNNEYDRSDIYGEDQQGIWDNSDLRQIGRRELEMPRPDYAMDWENPFLDRDYSKTVPEVLEGSDLRVFGDGFRESPHPTHIMNIRKYQKEDDYGIDRAEKNKGVPTGPDAVLPDDRFGNNVIIPQIPTSMAGSSDDKEQRRKLTAFNIYNLDDQYTSLKVDLANGLSDGQYFIP